MILLFPVALQQSMPDFRARLESRLRDPDQGADTIVWLCVAKGMTNGAFFQGLWLICASPTYLAVCCTNHTLTHTLTYNTLTLAHSSLSPFPISTSRTHTHTHTHTHTSQIDRKYPSTSHWPGLSLHQRKRLFSCLN